MDVGPVEDRLVRLVLAVLFILWSVPLNAETRTDLVLSMSLAASTSYDVEATLTARIRGYRELNPAARPFITNRPSAYLFAGGSTVAVLVGAGWLDRAGHGRLGKLVKVVGIVGHVVAGYSNSRLK